MNITETRVKLVNGASDRLKAYCSITIDGCFVVRDLKVIDGSNGLFVAMPSRKLATRCNSCSCKNHLRARFCNECGTKVSEAKSGQGNSRTKLHADVAHPINAECRQFIQERVIEEFQIEVGRSKDPDYVATEYDDYNDDEESPYESVIQELKADRQAERGQRDPEPNVVEEPEVEAVLYHDVDSDREPEPEPVAEVEEDLQPEDESEAEFGADLESKNEPEAEFGADLEPAGESEAEFGADLESEDEPEAEFGADLEPEAESEPESRSDPEPEAEPEPAADEVEAPAADAGDDDFGAGLI